MSPSAGAPGSALRSGAVHAPWRVSGRRCRSYSDRLCGASARRTHLRNDAGSAQERDSPTGSSRPPSGGTRRRAPSWPLLYDALRSRADRLRAARWTSRGRRSRAGPPLEEPAQHGTDGARLFIAGDVDVDPAGDVLRPWQRGAAGIVDPQTQDDSAPVLVVDGVVVLGHCAAGHGTLPGAFSAAKEASVRADALLVVEREAPGHGGRPLLSKDLHVFSPGRFAAAGNRERGDERAGLVRIVAGANRSEEHTSELQ